MHLRDIPPGVELQDITLRLTKLFCSNLRKVYVNNFWEIPSIWMEQVEAIASLLLAGKFYLVMSSISYKAKIQFLKDNVHNYIRKFSYR